MSGIASLLLIFGGLVGLLVVGMPIAFAFATVTIVSVVLLQGWGAPLQSFVLSIDSGVTNFTLLPIALFVLMGELLWQSNIANKALSAIDKWFGRIPGRLSLLSVASGTAFSALSGSTLANTAMLGKMLLPEMKRKGYADSMSIGPIVASGGLAMLVPPSTLAVFYATIAHISIGSLLIALILPGIMLACCYGAYIVVSCWLNPALAPREESSNFNLKEALRELVIYILPLSIVVFSVVGVIFFGIATPTEAAALGCVSSLLMAFCYGGLSTKKLIDAAMGTVQITGMMLLIMAMAIGFSQVLAYSGAGRELISFVSSLSLQPLVLIGLMMLVVLVLGCFMEQIAIMLITLPIFVPLLKLIEADGVWFAVMMLINLEMSLMTPPFGMLLFVMKGVAPEGTSIGSIYRASLPYLAINGLVIALILFNPWIVTILPSIMK